MPAIPEGALAAAGVAASVDPPYADRITATPTTTA